MISSQFNNFPSVEHLEILSYCSHYRVPTLDHTWSMVHRTIANSTVEPVLVAISPNWVIFPQVRNVS